MLLWCVLLVSQSFDIFLCILKKHLGWNYAGFSLERFNLNGILLQSVLNAQLCW